MVPDAAYWLKLHLSNVRGAAQMLRVSDQDRMAAVSLKMLRLSIDQAHEALDLLIREHWPDMPALPRTPSDAAQRGEKEGHS